MSGCPSPEYRDRLLDRDGGPEEARSFLGHVIRCQDCQRIHGPLLRADRWARAVATNRRRRRRKVIAVGIVAAVAASVLAAAVWFSNRDPRPLEEIHASSELRVGSLSFEVWEIDGNSTHWVRESLEPGAVACVRREERRVLRSGDHVVEQSVTERGAVVKSERNGTWWNSR